MHKLYQRLHTISNNITRNESPKSIEPLAKKSANHGILISFKAVEIQEDRSEDSHRLNASMHLFLGCSSALARLKHILSLRPTLTAISHRVGLERPFPQRSEILDIPDALMPSKMTASTILYLFSRSVNVFYPTIKYHHMNSLIQNGYSQGFPNSHDKDIFYLILAIGSQLSRTSQTSLPFASHVYFHKATYHPEVSRATWLQLSPLSLLQRTLLICIYLLLNPASGDVWRNLGFAISFVFRSVSSSH